MNPSEGRNEENSSWGNFGSKKESRTLTGGWVRRFRRSRHVVHMRRKGNDLKKEVPSNGIEKGIL